MEDLRREVRAIKNPALAKAQQKKKQKKITQGLSTDAMRREQILRNQQSARSPSKPTVYTPKKSTPTPKPSAPKPSAPKASAPKVTGIIPTTSNSVSSPVSATVSPVQSAPVAPAPQQKTTQQMIEEMNAQRLQSQLASLQAAYERSISGLDSDYGTRQNTLGTTKNTYLTNLENALQSSFGSLDSEQAKIQPFYYDKRNEAAAASDVGAMNFAQHMASRGVKGGAGGMPAIYQNAALQGRVGALDQAEAQDMSEIERSRSEIQRAYDTNQANVLNNYASDIKALEDAYLTNKSGLTSAHEQDRLSAESGVSAEGLQAFINQMNMDREFGLNLGNMMGEYEGQPTLAKQQFQFDADFRNKQFAADQAYRNKQLQIDSAYKSGQLSLQRAQQAMASAKFEYEKKQNALNRDYQERQFAYSKQQDALNRQSKGSSNIQDTYKGMTEINNMSNLTNQEKYNLAKKMGYIE